MTSSNMVLQGARDKPPGFVPGRCVLRSDRHASTPAGNDEVARRD